jgi:hypothetical protein
MPTDGALSVMAERCALQATSASQFGQHHVPVFNEIESLGFNPVEAAEAADQQTEPLRQ